MCDLLTYQLLISCVCITVLIEELKAQSKLMSTTHIVHPHSVLMNIGYLQESNTDQSLSEMEADSGLTPTIPVMLGCV